MSLVDRAKNMLMTPKTEWAKVDEETTTVRDLFTGYAVILALLPVVGTLIALTLSLGPYRFAGTGYFLVSAIVGYVIGLGILYVMGLVADALAPSFDGTKNQLAAMKLVVYAGTPMWIAGFFTFVPGLSFLISLAGFGYAAYLLYLGATTLMKVPEDKAAGYTAVTIIIWIVLGMVVMGLIVGAFISALVGGAVMTGAFYS